MLKVDSFAIEVTRRCNMNCPHCMRGEPESKDISREIIEKALENISSINDLLFTGGEPSLNVNAIRDTLEVCEENGIFVNSFYIATNGKEVTPEFLQVLKDWYEFVFEYGGDISECKIALSKDKYHEKIDPTNENKLRSLPFFVEDKFINWDEVSPVGIGRAKEFPCDKAEFSHRFTIPDECIDVRKTDEDDYYLPDVEITLTADGYYVFGHCYEYSEVNSLVLGQVEDPEWFLNLYS